MRLDILGVVLATAATVTADAFVGLTFCLAPNCDTSKGLNLTYLFERTPDTDKRPGAWFTDTDSYPVDGNEGCRNPGVPGIRNVCFDWGNRRLHFDLNGGGKRCMVWQAGRGEFVP